MEKKPTEKIIRIINCKNENIMELNEFVAHFAEQFEETEKSVFAPETVFHELD